MNCTSRILHTSCQLGRCASPAKLAVALVLILAAGCFASSAEKDSHAGAHVDWPTQIAQAVKAGQKSVRIKPGVYRVAARKGEVAHWTLNDAHDITIDATGVTLICTELKRAVALIGCHDVTIKGLTIDYDPLPFTQGEIVSLDPSHEWMDVRIDAGYAPPPDDDTTRIVVYAPGTHHVKAGTWTRYGVKISHQKDGTFRADWGRPIADAAAVGDQVSMELPIKTPHAVYLDHCRKVTLEDVTVHASTSFGIFEAACDGDVYRRCAVTPGPAPAGAAQPRLLSSNADAFHSKYAHVGPTVESCTFEQMGDDGMAINGNFLLVVKASGPSVVAAVKYDVYLQPGDRILGYPRDGDRVYQSKVVAIAPADLSADEIAQAVSKYAPKFHRSKAIRSAYRLTLADPVTLHAGDVIYSPDRVGAGFKIVDNQIRDTRARGMVIKSSDGVIADNVIERTALSAIVLAPEPGSWLEAGFSRHVRIRGNTLHDTGLAPGNPGSIQAGAISLVAGGFWHGLGHQDIEIVGNTFAQVRGLQIAVTGARDVLIRDNRFVQPTVNKPGGARFGIPSDALIWLGRVDDVRLRGNEATGLTGARFLAASPDAMHVEVETGH